MIPDRPFGCALFFPGICKFREEKCNGVHKSTKRVRVVSLPSKID